MTGKEKIGFRFGASDRAAFHDHGLAPDPQHVQRAIDLRAASGASGSATVRTGAPAPVVRGFEDAVAEYYRRLSRTQDNGYVGVSNYIPGNSATSWTRASVGDDGAAWWQKHEGEWSVVATTNGGHAGSTTGVLVQKYASWINEVFPGARLTSERLRVTASQAFVSHDFAADAGDGDLAFLVAPNQAELGETMLDVPVRAKWGNA